MSKEKNGENPANLVLKKIDEKCFKILVIGNMYTGKTNLVRRYVHDQFLHDYKSTIGFDIFLKVIKWDPSTVITLQLYDTAGQERYQSLVQTYYREAVGCLLLFDITKPDTFAACLKWKNELNTRVSLKNGQPISCILLANKCDLVSEDHKINADELSRFCQENGIIEWFETSSKDNINIERAFKFLIYDILLKEKENSLKQLEETRLNEQIKLSASDSDSKKKCFC